MFFDVVTQHLGVLALCFAVLRDVTVLICLSGDRFALAD
jgi:hypothetical protein